MAQRNLSIQQVLQDETWHFDFSFPMLRFDPLLSRTGLMDDLDWELPDQYLLPDLAALSRSPLEESSADFFRAAWHDRGLFGEVLVEFPTSEWEKNFIKKPWGEVMPPGLKVTIFIDTRASAGLGWGNEYCHRVEFTTKIPQSSEEKITGFGSVGGIQRAITMPPRVSGESLPFELKRLEKGRYHMRYFISKASLHGFDPAEYPEIGFLTTYTNTEADHFVCSARSMTLPIIENPGFWPIAKLVDR